MRLHCKSSSNSNNNHCKKPLKQQCARRKNTPRNELEKRRKNISPTCKSVKKVIFLLLCLVLAFGIQNVIFSCLKNTSSINSPTQVFFMNLIMCLIIFSILLAINKQPKQKYFDNASFHSSLDSNSSYRRSRLFETINEKLRALNQDYFVLRCSVVVIVALISQKKMINVLQEMKFHISLESLLSSQLHHGFMLLLFF